MVSFLIVMLNIPLHRFLSRLFALRICGAAFPVLGGGGRMGLVSGNLADNVFGEYRSVALGFLSSGGG